MREVDLGWVAGIIDGEGTVYLSKGYHKPEYKARPSKRGFCWNPRLSISNTFQELLLHFQKITGFGRFIEADEPYRARTQKTRYDLRLRNNEILALLPQIKDLLTAKRHQAELLIETLEILKSHHTLERLEDVTAVRDRRLEAIFWEMRLLNARGRNGQERVLEEIAALPSDPREFTKERYEIELKEVLETRKDHLFKVAYWRLRHKSRLSLEQREKLARWREEHKDWIREYNKRRWQETKKRLESDPEFRERYLAEAREKARRYEARKKLRVAEPAPAAPSPPGPSAPRPREAPRPTSG